jgi:hypothetical protein
MFGLMGWAMGSQSRTQLGRHSKLLSRVRGGLLFVAIVWSIAGAFLLLQHGVPQLFHRLLVAGWIPAELTLPDRGSVPVAAHCDELKMAPAPGPAQPADARFGGWKLGQEVGFAAGMANLGYDHEQLARVMEGVDARARALGVPEPVLPEIRHVAYALVEFQEFVRTDPQCVAAVLAHRFGEVAARDYRFGLIVGYVAPLRAKGFPTLFPAEIAHYGRLAGAPEPLWRPLTQESLVVPSGKVGPEAVWDIVERLDGHFATGG